MPALRKPSARARSLVSCLAMLWLGAAPTRSVAGLYITVFLASILAAKGQSAEARSLASAALAASGSFSFRAEARKLLSALDEKAPEAVAMPGTVR